MKKVVDFANDIQQNFVFKAVFIRINQNSKNLMQ